MAVSRLNNIWQILEQYRFSIDHDCMSDFICGLCEKIIIDAKQTPCGCKYCKKCIETFLANGKTLCPGKSDYCKEEKLGYDSITTDHFTNRKLMKQILECPNDDCTYKSELRLMPEHLVKCGKLLNICPYSDFGCNESDLLSNELNEHLEISHRSHLLLMANAISNLKNENGILVNGNRTMKEDLNNKQIEIDQLKSNLILTEEKLQSLIQNVEMKLLDVEQQNIDLNEKLNEMKKIESSERSKLEHRMNVNVNKIHFKIQESIKPTNQNHLFYSKLDTEYIWKISNLSEKLKLASYVFSEPFYFNPKSYKMMLSLFSDSMMGISIYPSIISGEFDTDLKFPVTCDVTIEIIDEDTKLIHRSQSKRIRYLKPLYDPELKFFFPNSDAPLSVMINDSIIIICLVNVIH